MNGFPKAAEVDNISWFFKHCLQELSETHSCGYQRLSETLHDTMGGGAHTKRFLYKTSPRRNISKQNVSLKKRLFFNQEDLSLRTSTACSKNRQIRKSFIEVQRKRLITFKVS
jgi:hypothetical protein